MNASFEADGKILAVETTIAVKDLPKAVLAALDEKYPGATKKRAEEIVEGEKTNYEVLVVTLEKKTVEVVLSPKGKIIEADDESEEEDARENR